jgi:hypothetical protein
MRGGARKGAGRPPLPISLHLLRGTFRRRHGTQQAPAEQPLTPAMTFCLMTGRASDARIRGWVGLAQAGQFDEPTPDEAWAAHREALIAEAAAAGFEPYWVAQHPPAGAGFRRWRDAFLADRVY